MSSSIFLVLVDLVVILAENPITPPLARDQPQDRAHQHGFAGSRAADKAQDLAAVDVEIELVAAPHCCRRPR
jgi:hypothetical protein